MKIPAQRASTYVNAQSCPYNERRELFGADDVFSNVIYYNILVWGYAW